MTPRHSLKIFWLLALPLLACIPANAQTDAFSEAGMKPYGSYQGSETDVVSLSNGKLDLHIPLWSLPQRGGKLKLGFTLRYFNPLLEETKVCIQSKPCYYVSVWSGQGVSATFDSSLIVTSAFTNIPGDQAKTYAIIFPDGSQHLTGQTGSTAYESLDATGLHYDSSSNVITDSSGVRFTQQTGGGGPSPSLIEDPNGNEISFSGSTLTDTLGRTVALPPSASSTGNTTDYSKCTGPLPTSMAYNWTVPTVSGGQATIEFCYANVPINFNLSAGGLNANGPTYYAYNSSPRLLQSVVLPNLTAYTFEYGSGNGGLTKIILPTGGSISYTTGTLSQQAVTCTVPGAFPMSYSVQVTSRAVDANDGNGPRTWTYSGVGANPNGTTGFVTLTDPNGNQSVHTITPLGSANCQSSFYETKASYYQGSSSSGKLLKSVQTAYSYTANANDPY